VLEETRLCSSVGVAPSGGVGKPLGVGMRAVGTFARRKVGGSVAGDVVSIFFLA